MKKHIAVVLALLLAAVLIGVPVYAAAGTGPGDALLPVGVTQTVGPHAAQWYYFDYSGGKGQINAVADAQGAGGIRLAIYTPQEVTAWQSGDPLTAIGLGGPFVGHDLGWTGNFNFAGRFYAVVYNDNDGPVSVSVRVTGDNVTTAVNTTPTPTPLPNPFATVTPLGGGIQGKLAFVNQAGGALYVVNGDGSGLHQVSFGMDPQWNHGGSQIALARQGASPGIFTISPDGSNENLIYQTNEARAPDWSPDNSTIIFSHLAAIKGGGQFCFGSRCFDLPEDSQWRLATASSAGGSFADVRATNHAFTPSWDPANANTYLFNDLSMGILQGSMSNAYDPFLIIGDLRVTSPAYNPLKLMSPQYSPDGKQIVYMVLQQPAWQIAVANADGTNQHLLTQLDPLDFVHPNNFAPVWSPDGKQILFLSDRNGKVEFFLMNADGSGQQQVLKSVSDQVPLNYEYESERMMSWTR